MIRPSPLPWSARFSPASNPLRSLWEALWDRLQGFLHCFYYEGDGAAARALLVQACQLLEQLAHQITQEFGATAEELLSLCRQLAERLRSGNAEQVLAGLSLLYYLGGALILASREAATSAAPLTPAAALSPAPLA
jgi:AcrR family transcriptional regulator